MATEARERRRGMWRGPTLRDRSAPTDRSPVGDLMSTAHPSVFRTASTLPSWAVGFPPSTSTRNRTPTPAAAASWSCRSPRSHLAARISCPMISGVIL